VIVYFSLLAMFYDSDLSTQFVVMTTDPSQLQEWSHMGLCSILRQTTTHSNRHTSHLFSLLKMGSGRSLLPPHRRQHPLLSHPHSTVSRHIIPGLMWSTRPHKITWYCHKITL